MKKLSRLKLEGVRRTEEAVLAVLPSSVKAHTVEHGSGIDLIVNGQSISIKWAGEGQLGDIRNILYDQQNHPTVIAARRFSPGACKALSEAGFGWVDETGAAEIVIGSIVVSRSGRPINNAKKPERWTPAVVSVAEVLLCGVKPTVSETEIATGLSTGSCTKALRFLTNVGLLEAKVNRGRNSARRVVDIGKLLQVYASAVTAISSPLSLQVGVVWRNPVAELIETGEKWLSSGLNWASTGVVAASVVAPYLNKVTTMDVYVDARSILGLEAVAAKAGLQPIEGGRLTLRPFPTSAVQKLVKEVEGLRVAPWPRIYADLRSAGVRGEEAAEHLFEVIQDA